MNHPSATTYVLDGSDADLRRLLAIAEVTADLTRTALRRVGVDHGWHALDCGCGPLGALPILAEMCGTDGHVVGVDMNEHTISDARRNLDALGLVDVDLIAGPAHELDQRSLGGALDLVYTRCFLMHQRDPAETLRHLATLLRPGGWLVLQEPLAAPAPIAHPEHQSLADGWHLLHDAIRATGVPDDAVAALLRAATDPGFVLTYASATCILMPPEQGFALHASTLEAAQARAQQLGIATQQFAGVAERLRGATPSAFDWVSTPFYLDAAFQRRST